MARASAKARSMPTTVADSRPSAGLAGVRVDEVPAALVGPGCRDGAGAVHLDHEQQPVLRQRVADADPPGLAGLGTPVGGDVAAGVDHRGRHAGLPELVERPLDGPALDQARRVHAAGHAPRVEPAVRSVSRPAAELEHLGDLRRRRVQLDLAAPQPAHRAVGLPRAEHVVDPAESRLGALQCGLGCGGGRGVFRRGHRLLGPYSRLIRRRAVSCRCLPDQERHYRSHCLLRSLHWVLP